MLKSVLLLTLILGSSLRASALSLQLEGEYSPTERNKAEKALQVVQASLPEEITRALPFTIHVVFKNVAQSSENEMNLGRAIYSAKRVDLNRGYLDTNPQKPALSESRLYKTLAHEVAHFYDRANIEDRNLQELRSQCRDDLRSSTFLCKTLQKKGTSISEDPEFMALTGWVESGMGIKNVNDFTRRLPNVYATSALTESFPVYFESYLFDPNFGCRMPALNSYFNSKFQLQKNPPCDQSMTWYVIGDGPEFKKISKKQIWAVDYFWAAEGTGAASGFGHSMLRLVVCNPHRVPGPDCYKDFDYHIVVSFAAISPTGSFASYAGATGKYPLNLFGMTYHKVRAQYNMTELRDLYAVPLKLQPQQLNRFIDLLYENHWNLNSSYYFVTRNCTTEISRMLLGSGLDLTTAFNMQLTTPSGFLDRLLISQLTYDHLRSKQDIKKNDLLYSPSRQKTVDVALALVSQASDTQIKTMDQYVTAMTDELFAKTLPKITSNERAIYAAYYLEEIRLSRLTMRHLMEGIQQEENKKELFAQARSGEAKLNYSYRFPGSFLTGQSYGIPSELEAEQAEAAFTEQRQHDIEALKELKEEAQAYRTERQKAMESAQKRVATIARFMKN